MQRTSQVNSGENNLQLPVNLLSSGTYIIKLLNDKGAEIAVEKFIKQ